MSRFGGGPVKVATSRPVSVNDEYMPVEKKPAGQADKAKAIKLVGKLKKEVEGALATLEIKSPIIRKTGGGTPLPESRQHARKIQSETIKTMLVESFKHNGDSQVFLGKGALKGLWIGTPMWASSAWDSDPIPGNLAMEWVAGATGLPIGMTITLAGTWGTTKSTLALEFMRWVDLYGGFGNYIEHESKLSPNMPPSLLGAGIERIMLDRAQSVEHWQQICFTKIDAAKFAMSNPLIVPTKVRGKNGKIKIVNKKENLGRSQLLGMAVDTITGKMSKENQDKILEKGHGDRAHPIEALMNTNFFKTLPNLLEQWPILMVLVSQTKLSKDSQGFEVKSKTGGQQVQFIESFDLDLRKVEKDSTANYSRTRIKIKNDKNSFGHDSRYVEVDVLRWEEPDDSEQGFSLRTIYDWNTATVQLLAGKQIEGRFKRNLDAAGWHLSVSSLNGNTGTAWSKTLGVNSKNPVSLREMGDMIHRNPEVLEMLRKALRIQKIAYMDGDIIKQREKIRVEFEKKHPNELGRLVAEHSKEAFEKEQEAAKKKKKKNAEKANAK